MKTVEIGFYIRKYLQHGPLTIYQLAELLDIENTNRIRVQLEHLVKSGLVLCRLGAVKPPHAGRPRSLYELAP